jgi:hypothetical protein
MRKTRRRSAALIIALATLMAINITPVSAITLQRAWTAKIGTSGINGRVYLKSYTNGVGSIQVAVKGLRANATYSVSIRNGTCSSLGSTAFKAASIKMSSTGAANRTQNVLPWQMTPIWTAARKTSFVVRLVSGSSVRCATLKFPKATRVVIGSLNISLPIIRGPNSYPKCKVAMWSPAVAQPREPGYTFIYAHARTGMFLPMLTKFRASGAAGLIGRIVKVYTSDNYVSYYKIVSAKKTQDSFGGAFALDKERLRLQTSTGPNYTYPKLIADAVRYKTVKSTKSASQPTPHPISC